MFYNVSDIKKKQNVPSHLEYLTLEFTFKQFGNPLHRESL